MSDRKITPKQQRFVDEYLIDLNAAGAYKRAGYSVTNDHAAAAGAHRLLTNVDIQKAIAAAQQARAKSTELTQEFVVNKLRENLARAMQETPVCDREGNPTGEFTYQGAVANKALELLGKHLGMFADKHEVEHRGGVTMRVVEEIVSDGDGTSQTTPDHHGDGSPPPRPV